MAASEQIKQLRDKTGISVMACKRALEEAKGDFDKALAFLAERGAQIAEQKSERITKAGIVDAYVHSSKQIGVLLELRSETDFVAKNGEFQALAHDIAMHIAASRPQDIHELMIQPFVKNPEKSVADYLKEAVAKFGENIEVARFSRFNI
ncbi:MAG: Elongation factor Ts [Candidatus Giovannonibacteria bacterium GW2011_GWA2_44_26]|uniref:Elongation factor Ts n=2 Tax=Parcubacteria group TaxID=1794811 RepID=A0A0G1IS99_9BACT|nr:MAG: Elongation factor Ts [Candidatus Giovannonibacteria bacterium GW2011_GWA2_44_26]OHA15681.1 MAG: translation elongation factor Ts [Candidatus Tagabacteria bacterium RIFCSPLOWO2_01_FULL_42_9]